MTSYAMTTMDTVSASEFKAKCLDLLDQVGTRRIGRLGITKHGRIVAVLVPPASSEEAIRELHGSLRGSVLVPEGVDLTAPVLDEPLDAEGGSLHA
jgi:prevent-host-death family protein